MAEPFPDAFRSSVDLQKAFGRVAEANGACIEHQFGKPLITVPHYDSSALTAIADCCGESAVFRLINKVMMPTALQHGTDRAWVDRHDFRMFKPETGVGHDLGGVEAWAYQQQMSITNVLCANPYHIFRDEVIRFANRNHRYGIPLCRLGLTVYDAEALEEIPYSDGYFFKHPDRRQEALIGGIAFASAPTSDLEKTLLQCPDFAQKVAIISTEMHDHLGGVRYDQNTVATLVLELSGLFYQMTRREDSQIAGDSQENTRMLEELRMKAEILKQKIGMIKDLQTACRLLFLNLEFLTDQNTWPDAEPAMSRSRLKQQVAALSEMHDQEEVTCQQRQHIDHVLREFWLMVDKHNLSMDFLPTGEDRLG